MGTRMMRNTGRDGSWWLMIGLFSLCVIGWSLAFSFKAGAAERADKTWQVSDFQQISISGSPQVRLLQGDAEGVSGRGDEDALDRLEVFVDGDELIIRPRRARWWNWSDTGDVQLLIEFRRLDALALSGSGTLTTEALTSGNLELSVSGSGDVDLQALRSNTLELAISGSAEVTVAGEVSEQQVRISGSADYRARRLASADTTIRISGSADAYVLATDHLKVRVSGSGSVRYAGDPTVDSDVSGSGSVSPI